MRKKKSVELSARKVTGVIGQMVEGRNPNMKELFNEMSLAAIESVAKRKTLLQRDKAENIREQKIEQEQSC